MAIATYVLGDDWCGLYADDDLVVQGHSVSVTGALEAFRGKQIEDVVVFEIDYRWLEDRGRLPQKLNDIPQEVRL